MFFLVDKEILASHKHVKQPVNIKVADTPYQQNGNCLSKIEMCVDTPGI